MIVIDLLRFLAILILDKVPVDLPSQKAITCSESDIISLFRIGPAAQSCFAQSGKWIIIGIV